MPEAIDLLLKELKLPAFSRHYQHHQEQAIEKGYGHVRYLSGLFVNRKSLIVIKNVCNGGHERRVCRQEKALPI